MHSGLRRLASGNGSIAVLLALLAVVVSWDTWQSEKAAQLEQLSEVAQLGAFSLDAYLGQIESELGAVSREFTDGHGRVDPGRAQSALARYAKLRGDLHELALAAAEGSAALPAAARRGDLRSAAPSLRLGRAVYAARTGQWLLPLEYGLDAAGGAPIYRIRADLVTAQALPQEALGADTTLRLRSEAPYAGGARRAAAADVAAADPADLREDLQASRGMAHYPLRVYASRPASALFAAWWARMQHLLLPLLLLFAAAALARRRELERLGAHRARSERAERQLQDLTRKLVQREAELAARGEEMGSFAYFAASELRAPLRGIDGLAYQLRKDYGEQLGESGRACLDRIRAASRQLGDTLDGLLRLGEVDLHAFKRAGVDLSALAREVAAALRSREARPGVRWVIAPGIRAEGDLRLLRLALHSLFENALKSTRARAAASIEFGVWPETSAGDTVYFVKDDGAGFDMKYADRLFRAFESLHPGEDTAGRGVGLALAQRIIRRHGGRIWAEAAPGQGAMFYFTLG